tara:strand:+ start:1456 stop:1599 length:144 start_codon:yes stop_codon:yes gene_type:complete
MIKHELAQIWITSDGERFINKDKAIEHEKLYQKHEQELNKLREAWNN